MHLSLGGPVILYFGQHRLKNKLQELDTYTVPNQPNSKVIISLKILNY